MTCRGRVSRLTDDSALPEAERAMLGRARSLIPRLTERAAAAAARQVPAQTIAEYHDAGILRILQPKRFGGMQGRFSLFSRIVEELTYGCDYAQWAILGAFLGEAGDPRHIAYLLAPLADVEIVDDWQVLGLAGTGSKSLVLHDVLIPQHRCVMVSDLFAGTPPGALVHPEYPVLRAPRGFLVSYSLPPVCIAHGHRALDVACRSLAGRVSRGVTRLGESEVVQMAIGEAPAAIDVATFLLHTGREASTAAVSSGRKITAAEALRARRDMTFAQHQVGWALERLCELTGARWVYDADPLQEIRRDVMTMLTHHAASRQAAMVPYGHMLLSRPAE